jgi:hypothetical protein
LTAFEQDGSSLHYHRHLDRAGEALVGWGRSEDTESVLRSKYIGSPTPEAKRR